MEQLGVADLAQGLAEARRLWQDWVEQDPRLASAPAVDGLRDWLMLVGIDAADEVLHALVQIGSPSGRRLPASGVGRGLGVAARRELRWPDGRRRVRRRMRWSPASSGWRSGSSLGGGTRRLRATCWRTCDPFSLGKEC